MKSEGSISNLDEVVELLNQSSDIIVLTGAGISKESGIPTFRGKEGFWTKGSTNYYPEELASYNSFLKMPETILEWYEYRKNLCYSAQPNEGHLAITKLEGWSITQNKKFTLITQNVDNLHSAAGTKNTIEVHGNIFRQRCSEKFSEDGHEYTISVSALKESEKLLDHCPHCDSLLRPHVLWFDETYSEELFSSQTCIELAYAADLLFVIGTTLLTSIPNSITGIMHHRKMPIIEINPEPVLNDYTPYIFASSSSSILPKVVSRLPLSTEK